MPINNLLQKLNPYQREAVLDESRAVLVNANVGSGKTTVLISKALYEHVAREIPLNDMVVLTFTNKAADEIRDRMRLADPQAGGEDMLWFGTFHSVAMKMLQTILPVKKLGYTSAFTILDPDERVEMAERLIAEHKLNIKYRNKLNKRLEAYPSGRILYGVMKHEDDIGRLCDLISVEKIRQNKMDFDDLIRNATLLLKEGEWSPQWVIVDEFQDCDNLQMELIRSMAKENTKLFAVGDPNQVIYSWRGGSQDIFRKFQQEYEAKEYSLPLNYRSSTTILEAAKCFLEDHSDLAGVREQGTGIIVRNHYSPFLEADYLADKIMELHEAGTAWQDIAVFYRMQRQSKTLEDVFQRKGIPFSVSVRKTLKDIPVLQWFFRLLNASVNVADGHSLISVLTDAQFGEGLTRAKVRKILDTVGGSELYSKVKGFSQWAAGCKNPGEIYGYFGLDRYLSPTSVSFQENKDNILTFLNRLEEYLQRRGPDLLRGLADFLNASALYGTDLFTGAESSTIDSVKLMTLHACKGLEFQYVFIIGVNYGLIPLRTDAARKGDQEEEKRLFFVGITRARDYLELSYYTNPGDPRVLSGESSYLAMIPRQLLDYKDAAVFGEVDLQAYRRMILENRNKGRTDLFDFTEAEPSYKTGTPNEAIPEQSGRIGHKVLHPKYGEGVIESENEDTITASFGEYGSKSFSKDFCPLQF